MGGGPTFQYGDMFQAAWNRQESLFVVTGNASINRQGQLVMGRGAAKQLKERVHGLAELFAESIAQNRGDPYGMVILKQAFLERRLGHWCRVFCDVGVFQVKDRFNDRADPRLIQQAARCLETQARLNPRQQIHMNMPGVGYGRLAEGTVLPFLRTLPNHVNIWRFSHEAPKTLVVINDDDAEDQSE